MKKIHLILIIIASIGLIGSLAAGGIHLYISQNTIPNHVVVGGWDVGGKKKDEVLKELNAKLNALQQKTLTLYTNVHDVPDVTLTLKNAGVTFEADDFRSAVTRLYEGSWAERMNARQQFQQEWSVTPHWNISLMKQTFSPDWEEKYFGKSVNASRRITPSDEIVYTPEISALRIDWKTLTQTVTAIIPKSFAGTDADSAPLKVKLPLYTMKPEVTVKSLKEEGIDRKIIEFSTGLGSSASGRIYNVSSAAKAIDGMELKPGDFFDYGKVIAKAEEKYGFREAPVILNGKLVPGIGGGICQVSSTVYNAALRTGLQIVERRNHSLPVSYLPKGLDATFAEGSINFRFKNTTGKSLIIRAFVDGNTLTVKFFGTFPQNTEYSLESRTIETLPVTEKFVQNKDIPVGAQEVLQEGKPGYIVETYQVKKVNGKVVERNQVSRDTYRPQNRLIAVHSGESGISNDSSDSKNQVVEDGVSGPNF
ncbi:vancomycin resistance protein [Paenibacillus sp. HJL G12]|uniref:Vancomycin resistance protein n=1 Tax=Paenibacillus dendrobii TaxID=2691084 RepID=A0A7X3IMF2_9BACL|nr:VanW family protein [Paenibacillus dendrobii]MWV46662.1 vancomycin resistance protein [Paenibacillus dendrobii]